MNINEVWAKMLEILERQLSSVAMDVWVSKLKPVCFKANRMVMLTPGASQKNAIINNYMNELNSALSQTHSAFNEVSIIDNSELENFMSQDIAPAPKPKPAVSAPQHTQAVAYDPAASRDVALVPRFTFDNFVVGKSNLLAYNAAMAVAEEPGKRYNPLFIYGGVGLGKTHLMHGIGNHIRAVNPNLKVMYVTSEKFMNELLDSIYGGTFKNRGLNQEFRQRYRSVDVLMIDDIQFVAEKESLQEEIFHTFNDLHFNGKQIIISSDRPPKEIAHLEERLRTRFEGGMLADIQLPDEQTRIAILQKKAQNEHYNVPHDVLEFIAQKISSNIREMEGLLLKIVFLAQLTERSVSMEIAFEAANDYAQKSTETLTADGIIEVCCRYYSVSREDMLGKKKNKEIVEPRQMCVYLITEILSLPLATIGQIFGGRDHTTIIHSRDKVSEQVKNDNRIKTMVQDIRNMIYKK